MTLHTAEVASSPHCTLLLSSDVETACTDVEQRLAAWTASIACKK